MWKKLVLPLSSLALTGCLTETQYYDRSEDSSVQSFEASDYQYGGNLELAGGFMRGDVGPVRGIDSEAALLTGYSDEEYTSVEVHADGRGGSAMNLFEVYGGIDSLERDTVVTYRTDEEGRAAPDGVLVLNCAGQARYSWDYDAPADEVDVEVTDLDDGSARVEYTARTFERDAFTGLETGEVSEVSGAFEVAR